MRARVIVPLTIAPLTIAFVGQIGCRGGPPRVTPMPEAPHGQTQTPDQAMAMIASNAKAARERYRAMTFEEFEAAVWREPEEYGGKYLVNGDQPILDRKQLQEFFETEVKAEPPTRAMRDVRALVVS
jgi:hypothetical protein